MHGIATYILRSARGSHRTSNGNNYTLPGDPFVPQGSTFWNLSRLTSSPIRTRAVNGILRMPQSTTGCTECLAGGHVCLRCCEDGDCVGQLRQLIKDYTALILGMVMRSFGELMIAWLL